MDSDGNIRTPRGLCIPETALSWTFARSAGAGGQNVNKTSSKASLTVSTPFITGPRAALARVLAAYPETIRVTQQTSRSQWRNRQHCITQIVEMIDIAATPPAPPRRPSRPSRGAIERRLTSKKRESEKKDQRRKGDWE
jgi:ribosome-associated protein